MIQSASTDLPRLAVRFYRTERGREPVREWLKALPPDERKAIGDEIRTLLFGWLVGMPLVRKLQPDLWEIRVRLANRIARVLFTIYEEQAILLHGFIKKTRKTPVGDLTTAVARMKTLHDLRIDTRH